MDSKEHFNQIAPVYDTYKEKNAYYYKAVKKLIRQLIADPEQKRILEIGCGTGNLLAFLKPLYGFGADISENMIARARKKHPGFTYTVSAAEELKLSEHFDYILMVDVIEHLTNVEKTIQNLRALSTSNTRVILTMANPFWEPVLMLAEKLNLKMPEGPHDRIPAKELCRLFRKYDLQILEQGRRLPIPVQIPILHWLNNLSERFFLIKKLGILDYFVLQRKSD